MDDNIDLKIQVARRGKKLLNEIGAEDGVAVFKERLKQLEHTIRDAKFKL